MQVVALVSMVRDLKLDIFSLKRQEEGLEALVQQIADLLIKHLAGDVIEACSQTLQHCAAHGPDAFKVGPQLFRVPVHSVLCRKLLGGLDALWKALPRLSALLWARAHEQVMGTPVC